MTREPSSSHSPLREPSSFESAGYPLTDEERMLLRMRDTLYEGNWDDFLHDLNARAADLPHVFVTVPTSPHMKATIRHHIHCIEMMRDWENQRGSLLSA